MIWHTMFGVVTDYEYMPYFPGHRGLLGDYTICEFEEEFPNTDGLIQSYLEEMKTKLVAAGYDSKDILVDWNPEGYYGEEVGTIRLGSEELRVRIK